MSEIGCVHGRFQPFHLGHLEYVLGAIARCRHLYIGITNFDLTNADFKSPLHRYEATENPFHYWQRALFIKLSLEKEGINRNDYTIVPFPIDSPHKVLNFVPHESVMYTTIYDSWNIQKIRRLREQGFETCVLWRRKHKRYEGKAARAALARNDGSARDLLPDGAYDAVQESYNQFANRKKLIIDK